VTVITIAGYRLLKTHDHVRKGALRAEKVDVDAVAISSAIRKPVLKNWHMSML